MRPVYVPPYRKSKKEHEIEEEETQKNLRTGIIRVSPGSPWNSPVVLVKKKDGSWRYCIDFRRVNAVTRQDRYLLPRIDDALDTLKDMVYLSKFDLTQGYWQIPMDEEDKCKTA